MKHEVRNRVSLSLGQVTFYPKKKLSVIADVYSRFFDSWDDKIFERYVERFDLVLSKKVDELSAGMRVKFGLALALSRNAELVILDEPTSGLDPLSRDDLLQDLRTLVDSEGLSLLFSTHQMTDLEQIADDITYLEQGRVRATEPLDSFLHRYLMIDAPTLSLSGQLREALVGATEVRDRTQAILPREFAASTTSSSILSARRSASEYHATKESSSGEFSDHMAVYRSGSAAVCAGVPVLHDFPLSGSGAVLRVPRRPRESRRGLFTDASDT